MHIYTNHLYCEHVDLYITLGAYTPQGYSFGYPYPNRFYKTLFISSSFLEI